MVCLCVTVSPHLHVAVVISSITLFHTFRSLQRTLNELKEYQRQHDNYLRQQELLEKHKVMQDQQLLRNIIHETQMAKETQLGKFNLFVWIVQYFCGLRRNPESVNPYSKPYSEKCFKFRYSVPVMWLSLTRLTSYLDNL